MRISAKTKREYAAIKFKKGLKPVEGGWLERGLMAAIQESRKWPDWMKRESNSRIHNATQCGLEP